MEQKTIDLISDAIFQMVKNDLKLNPKEFAIIFSKCLGEKTSPSKVERTFRQCWDNLLIAKLKEIPEPSPQQLAQVLATMKKFPPDLRRTLTEKIKNIRKAGAGGAPRLLSNRDEAQLCAIIATDRDQGSETSIAIRNAARKFGVSYWTAKRAWQRYVDTLNHSRVRRRRKEART